jgi:probable HAF family extracellular repeat protein
MEIRSTVQTKEKPREWIAMSLLRWLAVGVTLVYANLVNAQTYSFTDLGSLLGNGSAANAINDSGQVAGYSPAGATLWNGTSAITYSTFGNYSNNANAINNLGVMVGEAYYAAAGDFHATVWNGTKVTDLGTLGGSHSGAFAINDSGLIAGYSVNSSGIGRATLWNGTTKIDLGSLSGGGSSAYAINNAGQVAGFSGVANGYHATLWSGTSIIDLGSGASGGTLSVANAINDVGQVAGYASTIGNSSQHATLWNGTAAIDLGTLGGFLSTANAINNVGQVVGVSYITGNSAYHATLWNGDAVIDLNSFLSASIVNAGWELTQAYGINDSGWIVGRAYNNLTGQSHAFELAPIPEPETYAMMLAGLGLLGLARRRKQSQC